jgi:hypothetical protein
VTGAWCGPSLVVLYTDGKRTTIPPYCYDINGMIKNISPSGPVACLLLADAHPGQEPQTPVRRTPRRRLGRAAALLLGLGEQGRHARPARSRDPARSAGSRTFQPSAAIWFQAAAGLSSACWICP